MKYINNDIKDLIIIFEHANHNFIRENLELFQYEVSERTLCGCLMLYIHDALKKTQFNKYHVDVEYNRNKNGKLKTMVKTIEGPESKIIKINCDLIVHSRGKNIEQDNLIAIEMKKSNRPNDQKESDRERLICLTKDSYDDIWSFDGTTLPKHVCRYKLGVYYEIDFEKRSILIEYYSKGFKFCEYVIR